LGISLPVEAGAVDAEGDAGPVGDGEAVFDC
jgi:hypothetical protein